MLKDLTILRIIDKLYNYRHVSTYAKNEEVTSKSYIKSTSTESTYTYNLSFRYSNNTLRLVTGQGL